MLRNDRWSYHYNLFSNSNENFTTIASVNSAAIWGLVSQCLGIPLVTSWFIHNRSKPFGTIWYPWISSLTPTYWVLLSYAILSYSKISTNALLGLLQFVGYISALMALRMSSHSPYGKLSIFRDWLTTSVDGYNFPILFEYCCTISILYW
jgi:hypothetical protein